MPLASPHDKHITSGNKVLELLQLYAQFLHKSARLPHWQSKRHCHGQPLGRLPRHRCSCTARSSRHPPNLCAARFIRARRCVSVTFSMPKMDAPGGNIRRVSNPELARNWSATLHSRRSISPMSCILARKVAIALDDNQVLVGYAARLRTGPGTGEYRWQPAVSYPVLVLRVELRDDSVVTWIGVYRSSQGCLHRCGASRDDPIATSPFDIRQ